MSIPRAAKAALWIAGDRDRATGSPMIPTTSVVPVILSRVSFLQPVGRPA
jgi:hypothetical protein